MGTLALEGTEARRPSWFGTFGAVIGASILAWPLTLLWAVPLTALGLMALPERDRVGHGWPWRIDGAWSFAADLGPLLLCGIAFAWSFEALLGRFAGSRRQPSLVLALAAAAVGWVMVVPTTQSGLIPVNTFWAFVTMIVVARSVRHRPGLRLTRRGVAVVVGIGLALTATSVSYGVLHPLTAENGDDHPNDSVSFALRNDTRFDVRLRSVTVPGHGSTELTDWEGRTLVGTRLDGMASEFVMLKPPGCGTIESLNMRLTVAGRDIRQRVWLGQPVVVPCG